MKIRLFILSLIVLSANIASGDVIQKRITSFSAGELGPKMMARVDFAKYQNGLEKLENFILLPQGGIQSRAGLRYVAETKDSTVQSRLIRFIFSTSDAYILEFGNQYIRFYKGGGQIQSGGVPVEVATPYLTSDLPNLKFAQSNDVMYLVDGRNSIRKLSRTSDTAWTLATVPGDPPPSFQKAIDLSETLTPGATTGNDVTFTAGSAIFLAADIDKEILSSGSVAVIKTVGAGAGGTDTVTADITTDFASTDPIASGDWTLFGSPAAQITPDKQGPVGGSVGLTLDIEGWRSTDVGKFVKVSNGYIELNNFTSTTVMNGIVKRVLDNTTAVEAGLWTLNDNSWSSDNGFPRAIAFHGQGLWLGGTTAQPRNIWRSSFTDFEDFSPGNNDDDSIDKQVATRDPILWFSSFRDLVVGTQGAELLLGASPTTPLTPTSGDIVPQTEEGSKDIQPINVRGVTLFIERAGKKLNEFLFSFNIDKFDITDLTVLADHISGDGEFTEMSYQKEPHSIVWFVRDDGELAGLTYLREHQIVGWHRHTTNASGLFESVDTIPISGIDQTWAIVNRTVNGSTVRNVEYFDETAHGTHSSWLWDRLTTDSSVVYSGSEITVMTGLDHLEGETVRVLSNGMIDGEHVVTNGQITLNFAGTETEAGLAYTPEATTVRPDVAGLGGETIQGKEAMWSKLTVRLLDTLNGTINDKFPMETRQSDTSGDAMDASPPLFTGDVVQQGVDLLDENDRHGRINVKQQSSTPITVLGYFGEFSVN